MIFGQQRQFGLGRRLLAGPGGGVSYAKAHSFILQEAIYAPSVQWMGDQNPGGSSHHTIDKDDRTHDTGALDTIGASKRKEFLTELKS